ncbi:extracellular solute-binding protein [Nocardiopsis sp. HNM0947]|uniref:Extracellular solute-binding protein n=1 Tax=Nocardiopsis coralli TaxID=2772213 RepID=A0ABR9P507_9ACTN|nr:extracellular solute-binding protein [Nocardiopsis coralli]MBE2998918.1 extracellular solute-binding protein [Nocardiopsis coralli]
MPTTPGRGRAAAAAAAGTAAALVLSSCAVLSTSVREDDTPASVSTTVPDGPVTLRLAFTDDPPTQALVDGFTEQHPNVEVELQQTQFTDYIKTVKLSMSSEDPPDLAQYNPGAMESLVPAGLILDLDQHAEAYGWGETFPSSPLESLRTDPDAAEYGSGSLYAAPGALSILGVFYNKSLLEEAGVDGPPQTLDEFDRSLEQVHASGTTPLGNGSLEVGGFQLWNALLNVLGDEDDYRDWVYGAPGASIETPAADEATDTLTRWAEAGYLPEGTNATTDIDAQADFAAGESAFLVTGNWAAAELAEEMGDDVGFFLMPGPTGEEPPVASGSSVAYAVSSQSENADTAAAFLDYLGSPEAARIQLENGFMPVNPEAPTEGDGVMGEVNAGFGGVVEEESLLPFPDFATPGMVDQLTPGIQGLVSGTTSEEEFLRTLQEEWDEHHE